ncbi:Ceramide glucosyltransferase-B [Hypsibius exemplaris]|uniref:ceramide glucosyltransferase n=1 Tax=Hypsibius exemplaris TaxID=2072580 RepID=A0A1W0X1H0_HYPEX|nr:Ceramide glucosyltransferase-B [Hypsibius exemplaris]
MTQEYRGTSPNVSARVPPLASPSSSVVVVVVDRPRGIGVASMYHSGSPGDLALVVLAVVIFVFWLGVWTLHCVSIMYGKWRLYRSTTVQFHDVPAGRIRQQQQQAEPNQYVAVAVACDELVDLVEGGGGSDVAALIDDPQQAASSTIMSSSWPSSSTVIQVERDGDQQNITLFSGGLLPGVSVLKPLVGVDQYLMANLESFFTMIYPRFQLLFCVSDESDPAIMVVRSLMNKYPSVDARIFIGGENVGVNPKINNMMPGYRASAYDLLLVSDSSIMMRKDTLLDMVSTMLLPDLDRDQPKSRLHRAWDLIRNRGPTNGVGLVHQMPFSMDRVEFGFPACLEKVYFGSTHARIYLAADFLGINCPTGMSALMRKNLLDNRGGMAAFGKYLAEDYFFAKAMTDQGWRICISSQPAWQNSAVCHLAHFQDRLDRWAKLRFAMVPLATLLEPLQECVLLGVMASLAVSFLFGFSALGVFLVHIITWFLLDWTLLKTVQYGRLSYSKLDFITCWLFRESTCTMMFIKSLLNPRIQWKNGYYRLKWGGLAEVIKSPDMHYALGDSCSTRSHSSTSSSDSSVILQMNDLIISGRPTKDQTNSSMQAEHSLQLSSSSSSSSSSSTAEGVLLVDTSSSAGGGGGSVAARSRSRHVRSRSLPQKNPVVTLLHSLSSKLPIHSARRTNFDRTHSTLSPAPLLAIHPHCRVLARGRLRLRTSSPVDVFARGRLRPRTSLTAEVFDRGRLQPRTSSTADVFDCGRLRPRTSLIISCRRQMVLTGYRQLCEYASAIPKHSRNLMSLVTPEFVPTDGRATDGRTDNGRTNNGRTDNGRTDNGRTDNGRTDNGRTNNGRTDNGRTNNGRTNNGRTDNGRTDNGRTDNGRTDNGQKGEG